MRDALHRIGSLFRRRRNDADIADELRFHLETEADEARASGLTEDQARGAARRDLGNPALLAEDMRDAWTWPSLERLAQDVRYAARLFRRRPAFSLTAILTLMLGIGGATAVFSLADGLLLRRLPVSEPEGLLQLVEPRPDLARTLDLFTVATRDRLEAGSRMLQDVIGSTHATSPRAIEIAGDRRDVFVQLVSGNYFDGLGISAARGHLFQRPGPGLSDPPIAVISDGFWRTEFAADPAALGSRLRYGNREFTIAGITPPGFRGTEIDAPADIWLPIDQVVAPNDDSRTRGRWMRIMTRLAPVATREQAAAEASAILGRRFDVAPGGTGYSRLREDLADPLTLVALVTGLVVLIACANLANLTLAGTASRRRELALRVTIGASRARIIRQLLTEGFVLGAIGGALGLLAASWISGALLALLPPDAAIALPNLRFRFDLPVLGFAALLTCGTCVLFALGPALKATGRDLPGGDLSGRTAAEPRQRGWLSRGLLVSQIAMCTVLLIVAGVFLRTLANLRDQDAGYVADRLLIADVEPPGNTDERRDQLLDELRRRLAAIPGVETAAFSHLGQLSGGAIEFRIRFAGGGDQDEPVLAIEQRITPGFLDAMGTRLAAGRDFTWDDHEKSPMVAIVNEAFARRFFSGRDPIGQRFFRTTGSRSQESMEVVGVVRDSKWVDLRSESPAMYYRPYAQMGGTPVVRFAIRTSVPTRRVAGELPALARALDRRFVVTNVVPFDEVVDRTLVVERLVSRVSSAFGGLALLIAAIGLYGILAYSVVRRRQEIGVRIALGARPRAIEWMVLRESLALLAAGVLAGVPAAVAVTRLTASMLFGLGPHDPASIAGAVAVLAASTVAAAWLPARRAAGLDPIRALRED